MPQGGPNDLSRRAFRRGWPELANLLADQLFRLAEVDVRSSNDHTVRIPRFPTSGMSGGYVAATFWRDVTVPMLLERWTASDDPGGPEA